MVVIVILILPKTIKMYLKCGDQNVNICQQAQVVPATKFVLKV